MNTSNVKKLFKQLVSGAVLMWMTSCSTKENQSASAIQFWLTTGDRKILFEQQDNLPTSAQVNSLPILSVDTTQKFQTVDGFGYALTGGSAMVIHKLHPPHRDSLLRELFLTENKGIGISYLRISIGASDLDDHVFSYDDLPAGQTDPTLSKFSLDPDREHLIPVLQQIIGLNPTLKIMGSPWSPPTWMKTNGLAKGGSLKPEFYNSYAQYFVKYIQEMQKEGISIDAITVQNEPENPNNTPSLVMTAEEQKVFVAKHLGPAFQRASLPTKIIIFDHNCDHPEYPISILNDPLANPYIDGSAFHLYLGEIEAIGKVHESHPNKNVYFTEQWTSGKGEFAGDLAWHTKNLIIGATRNWSRIVLEWNLASDPHFGPHTEDGGCDICMGALTIGDTVHRNVSYYIIAHASKFVRQGSVRINSTLVDGLPHVAFLSPEGKKVLIVLNEKNGSQDFVIQTGSLFAKVTLPAGSVGTFVW